MTAKDTAVEHFHTLRQGMSDWERYKRAYSLNDLKKDRDTQNMVLHALLVTLQSCIDITNHLVAHLGLPKPNSYREAFEILASHGYLSEEIGRELQDLAAFRNILVHVYCRLDIDRVHEILQTKHDVIVSFTSEVGDLLS